MYYVFDDKGNKVEGLSKQEIYAVLQDAIDSGDLEFVDADSAFVSKLKCCVGGGTYKVAFVTQAVYNQLEEDGQLQNNALYFITDDGCYDDLCTSIANIINGSTTVGNATYATNAEKAVVKYDGTFESLEKTTPSQYTEISLLKIGDDIVSRKELITSSNINVPASNISVPYDNALNMFKCEFKYNSGEGVTNYWTPKINLRDKLELRFSFNYQVSGGFGSQPAIKSLITSLESGLDFSSNPSRASFSPVLIPFTPYWFVGLSIVDFTGDSTPPCVKIKFYKLTSNSGVLSLQDKTSDVGNGGGTVQISKIYRITE